MALFYLIAKKKSEINWIEIHEQLASLKFESVCMFPIPYSLNLTINGIGITASGEFSKNIRVVKKEVIEILEVLWSNQFDVYDLYQGELVNSQTYMQVLSYL